MYARKRFDIGWLDLCTGILARWYPAYQSEPGPAIERWFSGRANDAFACLSVRSGLELYLEVLDLPKGSEVLFSALTIPDMWRVIERHGLVPVPVDVEPDTLAPRPEAWLARATPRTKLAIVAHLFGMRVDVTPCVALRARGIRVLEDCAQAFTGPEFKGDPRCDVSMFSFGPIKTSTALAGGVLVVREPAVLAEMRARHAAWPVQSSAAYSRRVWKYAGLKLLSSRPAYGGFTAVCRWAGKDIDAVIQGTVRGFKGGDFFEKIRHRPCPALLALLRRRLETYNGRRVEARIRAARRLVEGAGGALAVPGSAAPYNSYWVFTLLCDEPAEVVRSLRERGFDATRVATLSAVPAPADRPGLAARGAEAILERLVYVPLHADMSDETIDELKRLLTSLATVGGAAEDADHREQLTSTA